MKYERNFIFSYLLFSLQCEKAFFRVKALRDENECFFPEVQYSNCAPRAILAVLFSAPVFLARGEGEARLRVPKEQGEKPTTLPEAHILLIAPKGKHEFSSNRP